MSEEIKLLPCPFPHEVKRGVFVEVDTIDLGFVRVSCSDCGCAGPYVMLKNHERATAEEKAEAIAAWNTRALNQPLSDSVVERVARTLQAASAREYRPVEYWRVDARDLLAAIPPAGGVEELREALEYARGAIDGLGILLEAVSGHKSLTVETHLERIDAALNNTSPTTGAEE